MRCTQSLMISEAHDDSGFELCCESSVPAPILSLVYLSTVSTCSMLVLCFNMNSCFLLFSVSSRLMSPSGGAVVNCGCDVLVLFTDYSSLIHTQAIHIKIKYRPFLLFNCPLGKPEKRLFVQLYTHVLFCKN